MARTVAQGELKQVPSTERMMAKRVDNAVAVLLDIGSDLKGMTDDVLKVLSFLHHNQRQIDRHLAHLSEEERKIHVTEIVSSYMGKAWRVFVITSAICSLGCALALLKPEFFQRASDFWNNRTVTNLDVTVVIQHVPTAEELSHLSTKLSKVFEALARVADAGASVSSNRDQGYRTEHQSLEETLKLRKRELDEDKSAARQHLDQELNDLRQTAQKAYEAFSAMTR